MTPPADWPFAAAALAAAFLAGSLPTAWIVVRLARGEDIRRLHSGNPGASNVKRVLGWPGFLTVFAVDAAKGALPVAVALDAGWPILWAGWLVTAGALGWAGTAAKAWPRQLGSMPSWRQRLRLSDLPRGGSPHG